ncbi:choice-of-anchor J domain-containing protein, partial [bacterium]|nr:choice-of-anchor J domain-containing protein [bacterium]
TAGQETWRYVPQITFTGGGTILPHAGTRFLFSSFNGANGFLIDEWLISPQIMNLPVGTSTLKFWGTAVDGTWKDSVKVKVSTTLATPNAFTQIAYLKIDGPTGTWHEYSVDLTQFGGSSVYIAWNYFHTDGGPNGNNSDNVAIDDFKIEVNSAPQGLTANPTSLSFGTVNLAASASLPIALTNGGTTAVTITGSNYSNSDFSGNAPATVDAGATVNFNVTFAPSSVGAASGTLTIPNSTGTPVVINLSGTGFDPTTTFWSENFATATLPTGWQIINNDGGGATGQESFVVADSVNLTTPLVSHDVAGPYFVWGNYNSANGLLIDEWLISPQIALPSQSQAILKYWGSSVDGTWKDSIKVKVSTTLATPNAFTELVYHKVDGPSGVWHEYTLDLSAYSGQNIYIAWNYFHTDGGPNGNASDNIGLDDFKIDVTTDVNENPNVSPSVYSLSQNYPNPFNPTTAINFSFPKTEQATLNVYNVKGQLVRTLVSGTVLAGNNKVFWNGTDDNGNIVSSGVYFYSLKTASGFETSKKATFLK